MKSLNEFLNHLPEYYGVILLMFSTFLVGYITAYFFQRNFYKDYIRKLKRQSNQEIAQNKISDIETIFSEIKPRIIEVVKETQKEKAEDLSTPKGVVPTKSPQEIAEMARTSYLSYTKNKPTLNFENFGYADVDSKEDLTKINGIGPYIEQRLNEIGIYNYEQISRFKEEDIRVLTDLIDFFPGRIERDNWIGQAEALLKY
jgi:predicted flap endonuclease-1-like 5' DNA nuclease